jgi:tetratricopeptide (TPR) repeat protein
VHIINALLVYRLLLLTFRTPYFLDRKENGNSASGIQDNYVAFFSALLFAVHPVQTQAVTYIVQRYSSLAATFCLLSAVMYVKAGLISMKGVFGDLEKGRKIKFVFYYVMAVISAVLSMKTKETAFTMPVVIAVYELMFFKGRVVRRILCLVPLMLTMLIIPLSIMGIDKPVGEIIGDTERAAAVAPGPIQGGADIPAGGMAADADRATRVLSDVSRVDYLLTEFRVITTYIRLMFLPVNQSIDYDYPVYHSFFSAGVFLSFIFLLAIAGTGAWLFYRYRNSASYAMLISFGIFWFFITLSVESSIIPIVDVIYEHRLYMPSAGLLISFCAFLFIAVEKFRQRRPEAERQVVIFLLLISAVLTAATYMRNNIWKDELTLWSDAAEKSPENLRVRHNLGNAYLALGRFEEAQKEFQFAMDSGLRFAKTHFNMGIVYESRGLPDKALEQYRIALQMKPDYPEPYINLGSIYNERGLTDKAIEHFMAAIKYGPRFALPHYNLGKIYEKKGLYGRAIKQYLSALKKDDDFVLAYIDLGIIYHRQGLVEKAMNQFRNAVKAQPGFAKGYYNLGLAYHSGGNLDRALEQYEKTVALDPGYAEAYNNMGSIFWARGNVDGAIKHYRLAIKTDPGSANAHNNLGSAYRSKGLIDEAIAEYKIALELDPGHAKAKANLRFASSLKGGLMKQKGNQH